MGSKCKANGARRPLLNPYHPILKEKAPEGAFLQEKFKSRVRLSSEQRPHEDTFAASRAILKDGVSVFLKLNARP